MRKRQKLFWFLLVFVLMMGVAGVASATDVRVLLGSGSYADVMVASGSYTVQGNGGSFTCAKGDKISLRGENGQVIVSKNGVRQFSGGSSLRINENGNALNLLQYQNVMYRGNGIFYARGYLVNHVDIEEYLYGVVSREIGYNEPEEAMKAQAVASRSFAAYSINHSSSDYYDLTRTTQVYGGYTAENAYDSTNVYAAVKETAGEYACYDGQILQAFFSAHAGGYTENNENVWGEEPIAYLRAKPSPYDEAGTAYNQWTVTYTPEEMKSLAESYMASTGQKGSFGSFQELRLYRTDYTTNGPTVSGRVTRAEIVGTDATVTATKNNIRTLLDLRSTLITATGSDSGSSVSSEVYVMNGAGDKVRSSWHDLYAIDGGGFLQLLSELTSLFVSTGEQTYQLVDGNEDALRGTITITGKGYGHGVGMSQYGAIGMAEAGYDYEEILRYYFSGEDESRFSLMER